MVAHLSLKLCEQVLLLFVVIGSRCSGSKLCLGNEIGCLVDVILWLFCYFCRFFSWCCFCLRLFCLFLGFGFGFSGCNGSKFSLRLASTFLGSGLGFFFCSFCRCLYGLLRLFGQILEEWGRLSWLALLQVEVLTLLAVDGIHTVSVFLGNTCTLALGAHRVLTGIISGLCLDNIIYDVFL